MAGTNSRSRSTLEVIHRARLFAGIDAESARRVAAVAVEHRYGRGQVIFSEGDPGDSLYLVLEGRVKIVVTTAEGDEMLLATLEPPATFGEVSLLDGGRRSASAIVMQPSRLASIDRHSFMQLAAEHALVLDHLHRVLGELVRRLTEQAADLAFLDLHGRVAKLLVQLLDERLGPEAAGLELDLGMTQSELASRVGGSRQSVNQILHAFDRSGYLQLQGQRIRIRQPELLRKRSAGL